MLIRSSRDDLLASLQAACAVCPNVTTKPICNNVLLQTGDDYQELEVIATDLDKVGLRAKSTAEIVTPGQIIVPARQLLAIIKESSSQTVELRELTSETGSLAQIKLDDGDFTIRAVVGEEFPPVIIPDGADPVCIHTETLQKIIAKVSFAADKEKTSPALAGILIRIHENKLTLAATDSKVLAESSTKANPNADACAIIPAKSLQLIQQIATGSNIVEISLGDLISVNIDNRLSMVTRSISEKYPPYQNALPPETKDAAIVKTAELMSAVKRTMNLAPANKAVVLHICNGTSSVRNAYENNGTGVVYFGCQYDQEPKKVGVNGSYLHDVLRSVESDMARIELNGKGKGIIIRECGTDCDSIFLVMPITLPGDKQ